MSELRQLVDALRSLSDDELRSLITTRLVSLSNLEDFYALAEVLNSPKSYSALIGTLTSKQIGSLLALSQGEQVSKEDFSSLTALLLAYESEGGQFAFEPLLDQLRAHKAFTQSVPVIQDLEAAPDQNSIDRNCGLVAFETMQALTELVFDVEKHLIREVGKGGVGLGDVKRLAVALAKPNDYVKNLYGIANQLGLLSVSVGRHLLTTEAIDWLNIDQLGRMRLLFRSFRDLLGSGLIFEIRANPPVGSLKLWLEAQFPLAENSTNSKIGLILKNSHFFGLTFDDFPASWFAAAVADEPSFEHAIGQHLPAVQPRIILQSDLSIIAPGPLPTELESKLRRFANTETIGLASTYRLSSLSICHGLETGLTAADIGETLVSAFGAALPQPVQYLLTEVESRFERLVIKESKVLEYRATIESSDNVLLTEISNDPRLKPFSMVRLSNEKLACRFEPSVVYFGLRECGYLAIRKDPNGNVVSPIQASETAGTPITPNKWDERIAKLREVDRNSVQGGNDEVMTRQVLLAIRNKAKLSITVNKPDGVQQVIELEPNSIANGRLRGLDRKAQVERTLPMAHIASIALA